MTLQLNGHPRFGSQFIFKKANTEQQQQIQSYQLRSNLGEVTVQTNQPKQGNVLVNVSIPDPYRRSNFHEGLFKIAENLGLDVLFKPDKQPTLKQMQQSAKRLQKAFSAEFQKMANATGLKPEFSTNGHALNIVVHNYEENLAVGNALNALKQTGVVQEFERATLGIPIKESFFEGHNVHTYIDPQSEYYKRQSRQFYDD